VIFNRPIFEFRSAFLGVAPQDRRDAARARILSQLNQPGAHAASVAEAPQGAIVSLDGVLAFVVTPDDLQRLDGETVMQAAQRAAAALDAAAAATRESRDLKAIVLAAGLAAAATAIFAVLVWALGRLRQAVHARLSRLAAEHAERVRISGVALFHRESARLAVRRLVGVAYWVVILLAAYEWLGYVLTRFPYTRPWGYSLTDFLVGSGRDMLEGMARALPDIAIAVAIFIIARAAVSVVDRFMRALQLREVDVGWLDADTARPTRQIVVVLIWVFALVMAYPYLPGSDTEAFKGVSVLLGLMISLGGSSLVAQGASGLILMYTRTLRPGEYVRIGDSEGTVVELGTFVTRIRTGLGEELTLPSGLILGTVTHNYSRAVRGEGFVVDASVTIGYDVPWRQVHAMLKLAAQRTPGVLESPAPRVYQTALSDFYVEYRLVCQAIPGEPRPRAEVISSLNGNILDVFNEHGVQIMSPHYFADPAEEKVVPKSRWFPPPADEHG
jgi:small-conductance mechanosensitive channel